MKEGYIVSEISEMEKGTDERERAIALLHMLQSNGHGREIFDYEASDHDDTLFVNGSTEYLIVTDSQADVLWEREIDNYFDACVLPEIPEHLQVYMDEERWKEDAYVNGGRGQSLSHYDGVEYLTDVNGKIYYIYRQH